MAYLIFEDETTYSGVSFGAPVQTCGEAVFNTAMTGYQEVITDPSYAGQMVIFSYPHIGNTGITAEDNESLQPHCHGVVVRDYCTQPSNWRCRETLSHFLKRQGIPAITGIDTRSLVQKLRSAGAMRAVLDCRKNANPAESIAAVNAYPGITNIDLASTVSCARPSLFNQGASADRPVVALIDFGVKNAILENLAALGYQVWCYPATAPLATIFEHNPVGVVLSNGPGNPSACPPCTPLVTHCINRTIPLLGICLGFQMIALALGAKTQKMKFGHHGVNHPIQDLDTKKVFISSQNHSYEVVEASLPHTIRACFRSLFDGSLQGFVGTQFPLLAVQGHPEAHPGPNEYAHIFQAFHTLINNHAKTN